jgi:hypothetical protein
MTDEEDQKCFTCDLGLAIFGIIAGAILLAVGIDVAVKTIREHREVTE